MFSNPDSVLPGAVRRKARMSHLFSCSTSAAPTPIGASSDLDSEAGELLPMLESHFGHLDKCFAPLPRREEKGFSRWLRVMRRGKTRGRFALARDIGALHAGSRHVGSGRARGEMFSGTTAAFSIADLFGMLRASEKTGVLGVALGGESLSFHLDRGRLVFGQSDNAPAEARLGQILVRMGVLKPQTLRAALARQRRMEGHLGRSLLGRRLVTSDQLCTAVREQYRNLIHRGNASLDAPFMFHECEVNESPEGAGIDLNALLLEAASEWDESEREDPAAQPVAAEPFSDLASRLRNYRPAALGVYSVDAS